MYLKMSPTSLVEGDDCMRRIYLEETRGTCPNKLRAVDKQLQRENDPSSFTLIPSKASKSKFELLVN